MKGSKKTEKTPCEMRLAWYKRKSFLHRIVTGDEKWFYFKNPKRKRLYIERGAKARSTARPDRFGKKAILCVFWDQCGIIGYALLQPDLTVNGDCYQQQLADLNHHIRQKCPKYEARQQKIIFHDDNVPPHRSISTHQLVESYNSDPLAHAAYSPDLVTFHLLLVCINGPGNQ
uniref:Histonelysine Nmethyltransferase SETMARlike [Hydra vulgaris] n=1 Tax=Lepeophtheirus salmonis TaxID=72036 RepID=A0A0K2TBZ4_LEPSM